MKRMCFTLRNFILPNKEVCSHGVHFDWRIFFLKSLLKIPNYGLPSQFLPGLGW